MADDVHRQIVRIENDDTSSNRVRQAAVQLQSDMESARATVRELGRDLGITDDRLAKYGDNARQVGRRIDTLSGELDQLRRDALEDASGLDELRRAAQEADQALDDLAQPRKVAISTDNTALEQARRYGDVETPVRAVTGAIGYLGGTEFEHIANIGAELLAVNEAAGLLRHTLPELVDGMGMTNTSAALLAGGTAAAAAGIYLIYDAITDASQKARERAEEDIELLKSKDEGYAAGLEMTTRQIDEAIEAQQREIAIKQNSLNYWNDIVAIGKQYDQLNRDRTDAMARQPGGIYGTQEELDAQKDAAEAAIAAIEKRFLDEGVTVSEDFFAGAGDAAKELSGEIDNLQYGLDGLTDASTSALVAANDLAAAEEELLNTRRDVADQLLADAAEAVQTAAARDLELETILPDDVTEKLRDYATELAAVHAQQDALNTLYRKGGVDLDYYQDTMQALNEAENDLIDSMAYYQTTAANAARQNELHAEVLDYLTGKGQAVVDTVTGVAEALGGASEELANARAQQVLDDAELRRQVASMTQEQIDARLEEIALERQITQDLLATLEAMGAAPEILRDVRDQLASLDREETALQTYPTTLTNSRAQTEALDAIEETAEQLRESWQTFALGLARDEADFQLQRARDWNDHYQELATLDQDYFAERADILADMAEETTTANQERLDRLREYNTAALRLAEDHEDELLQLQRDADRTIERAAGRLDATALFNARQDLADATADAQAEYEKQQDRREEDFAQQLALLDREREANLAAGLQRLEDLDRQHEEERRASELAFAESLRREDEDRRIKLQRQIEDQNLKTQKMVSAYDEQQLLTSQHWDATTTITQSGMDAVNAVVAVGFQTLASTIQGQINTLLQAAASASGASGTAVDQAVYAAILDLTGGVG